MKLSNETTTKMLHAAVSAATGLRVNGTIATDDSGGNLKGLLRMDDSLLGSLDGAIRKAKTSAMSGMSTAAWFETYTENATFGQIAAHGSDEMLFLPGGEPLWDADNRPLGGIGFSGGMPDQDVEVVRSAIAAV